jgi:hypothetical protein
MAQTKNNSYFAVKKPNSATDSQFQPVMTEKEVKFAVTKAEPAVGPFETNNLHLQ